MGRCCAGELGSAQSARYRTRTGFFWLELTEDDDRSAVTFWLPKSQERREALARAFEEMAAKVRDARPETGLD